MIVIGLTGGIASGKSFVASRLAELGASVLDADRHAHAALSDEAVIEALQQRWGQSAREADGRINHRWVAQQVFGDSAQAKAERSFLEGLIHPRVRARLTEELNEAQAAGLKAAVLDIPLLHEAGWAAACDRILFVETSDAVRQARAALRGWDPAELARREATQLSLAEKRALAHTIIPGDTPEEAQQAIDQFWQDLLRAD
ncbi:dephospho-CoA kinase [Botrimarina hoheduenensis]|uniref:Dephospho-CoA kinase n=1 Tax=Botrimarina hoheduenensis TaxID=2528000 RepID=A0A5C5WDY4_9BACT|nr:dephospho-CoA kinase [Botrimarina hoheduenensis]TWT48810.1 Dephospho-CoA kinase [Botrimarina hoheduenensis]